MFGYVAYLAGKEGIAYSDVLTTIVSSYAVNVPKNTRDQAECEFAGICARIKRAIDERDPSGAAGAAAEAVLYWEPEPTEWQLEVAEMAAALASTIAAEWTGHQEPENNT